MAQPWCAALAFRFRQPSCGCADYPTVRQADHGPWSVSRRACRHSQDNQSGRDDLRLGGRDDCQRPAPWIPRRGGSGELSPSYREIQDHRNNQGHNGSGVVHSQSCCMVSFSLPSNPNSAAGLADPAYTMPSSNHNHAHSPARDRTVVIMAKAPRLGGVKSRLSQTLAQSDVLELYRCFLDDTVALAHSLQDVDVCMMCPAGDVE